MSIWSWTMPSRVFCRLSQSSNPDAFYVVPSSVGIGPGETDFSITVFSLTREYEITIMDEWMEEVSREGDPKTGETVTFHVQANTEVNDGAPRVGVVSVCITNDSGTCVPVIVQQAGRYDPQVLAFRFTATWCGYCPYMDEAFKTEAAAEPHFEFVTIHGGGSDIVFNEGSALEKAYDISGYPTGILAGWKEIKNYTNVSTTVNSIQKALDSFVESFPCTVKPSATAKIEDGKVVVSASVNSTIDSEYSVAAVVLESDIVYPQKFYPTSGSPQTITDFVHDNIARATLTESIAGDAFEAKAGEPVEFSWSAPVDAAWNTENLSVAVWVYSGYGDLASLKAKRTFPDNYIANVCIVPVE